MRGARLALSPLMTDSATTVPFDGIESWLCGCGFGFGVVAPGGGAFGVRPRNGSVGPLPGFTMLVAGIGLPSGSRLLPVVNCCVPRGVNGSADDCDSRRGERPRKLRLLCVPTHIGAMSSSVMSGMRMMCGVIVSIRSVRCRVVWSFEKRRPRMGISPRNGVFWLVVPSVC